MSFLRTSRSGGRRRIVPILVTAGIAVALGLGVWGVAAAQDAKAVAEKLAAIREAAADRDLGAAERRFAELVAAGPGQEAQDEGSLLLAKTRLVAGKFQEAADAVRGVVDRTDSPWHVKALYLTAESAARRRSWAEAAEIYAKRAEWATSDLHKAEVASLYREIADAAFDGDVVRDEFGREKKVPDWSAARDFYGKVLATFVDPKDAPLVRWRLAESQFQSGDPASAVAGWTKLLADGAGDLTDDTLDGIGRAQQRMRRFNEARATFEKLRAEHADSPFAPLALLRIGETYRDGGSGPENAARVVAAWREFLKLHPTHERAPDAAWMTAEYLTSQGDTRAAADAYRDFLVRFPDHERGPEAQNGIARSLLAALEFDKAIAEWQGLLARWPNHPLWAEARKQIVAAAYRKGTYLLETEKRDEARAALETFIAAYPAEPQSADAQKLVGEILAKDGKHEAAVEAWRLCAVKYPQFAPAPEAMFRVAETYEGPLANLEKALAAYEEVVAKWPGSAAAGRARGILVQMKGKSLEFTVARPFRTDEELVVPVKLRNVSKLRMKAYKVRLDEYLRRKGGLDGVGDVVVDVVKPDFEWDWSVPEFAKYRLVDRRAPLPVGKPGAYIVTAAEEELTATFLVIVSDLTTIAKSAAGQSLVFVYDERTGKPVEGAAIALLDAPDAAGTTGADGVWKMEGGPSQVRAVVTGRGDHAGHVAYVSSAAQGASAFGYATKAFLWTDRPVYRPGQVAKLRAVIRRVRDGRYVTEKDLAVAATVTDPRGATLLSAELRTDEFGFVSTDLQLASEPALGTHTLQVTFDGYSFAQTFDVMAYKKPDVLADVVAEKRAYLAGDVVKAKASLRYTVGGKVAGAPVRWSVSRGPFVFDASAHEAFAWFFRDPVRDAERARQAADAEEEISRGEGVTDEGGNFEVTFTSEALDVDRTYVVTVDAQDPNRRWVRASTSVPVTTRGIWFICKTEKKVYRPGEAVRLDVTAVDPLHVPVAVEGRAVLLRRRLVDQHYVTDQVAEVAAKTGDDGHAVAELKATTPGEHVVRFVAKDARGREVIGETTVTIAGDAEDLAKQARLIADREFYKEGDVAKVFVNVPVAPAPVLLTWEGEKVLEHRILMVTERASTVDMPLRAEHAPNVFLRMAVAKGGTLYEDGDEVAVFQYLDVQVAAEPGVVKPGQKVKLTVTTTDQSGRPVRAQVGVDVVDAAVYQIAPDRTAQMKPFFYDQRRTHGVRTASSAAALPALTRPTNKDLLFEQMRRLGKAQWEAMQEHVRLGRSAIEGGDVARAQEELRKALEIAPGNYEARMMLESLEERDRVAMDKAKAPAKAPPAGKPAAPATAAASRPGESARQAGEDHNESAEGEIGAGGGGGGAFGGRKGGVRRLRSSGGANAEKKSDADLKDALAMDDVQGDVPADAREPSDPPPAPEMYGPQTPGGDGGPANGLIARLAASAPLYVPPELRQRFEDTAYSSPSVRTGDDGKGGVEIDLPDNITEWKVSARGAGQGPLVGEGATRFRTAKDLLVRPDTPRFLTQGDRTTPTGTVHSTLDSEQDVNVRFSAEGATAGGETSATVKMSPGSVRTFESLLDGPAHGLAKFKVEALTAVESDAAVTALPIIPYGLRRLDGASGILTEEAYAELDLPASSVEGTPSIAVTLSPSADIALLESIAFNASYPWGCVEQTVNRFLPAIAAREALASSGSWNERLKAALDDSVRRGLAALYSMQNDDGSFGWFGAKSPGDSARGGADPEMTAYAVLGIVRAEKAGYAVSPMNRERAIAAAKTMAARPSPHRAFLLYALSWAGQADLEPLNTMFRERTQLGARDTSLLALAMVRSGRPGNALELVRSLESKATKDGGLVSWESGRRDAKGGRFPRPTVDAEPTAYALIALLSVEPENALVDGAAAWLAANRRGPSWRSTRDTGAAIEALALHAMRRSVARAAGDVAIYLNDDAEPVASVSFGGPGVKPVDAPVATLLPAAKLKPGRNKVILRRRGAGNVHWSALASAVELPGEKDIVAGGVQMSISREYSEHIPAPLPGQKAEERIVPGWSVVAPAKRPQGWTGRPLGIAGTGDKVLVTLNVVCEAGGDRVIVEDALPAGFEVVSGSASGPFDREERRDDRQVFFLSRIGGSVTLSYVIQAIHPGEYRALPAQSRLMYEPEIHAWSAPRKVTVTRDPGAVRRAPTAEEITPDEMWGLALRAFNRKDWANARSGLEGLLAKYELRPDVQEAAWATLFAIGVEVNDAKLVVLAFEQMTDRNPRRSALGIRERGVLAASYRTLGENERATVLLRDLVRDLAALDFEAAQAFAQQGNPWRGRTLVQAALRRLPDAAWSEEIELGLARNAMTLRAPLPLAAGASPVRRTTTDSQPFLLDEAVRACRSFQAHHADSPLAHEAGLLAVNALMKMKLEKDAVAEGEKFIGRFPSSPHLDDVTLLVAQGSFDAGDYDRALAVAKRLLEGVFPVNGDSARQEVSPFRNQGLHIAAKISHARGDLSRAVALYSQVSGLFPDAADALNFITQRGFVLNEVESGPVGEPAKLHIRRKNVPTASLDVYAVDFMILYAMKRDLASMNRIDLSGIEPVKRFTAERRGPEDYKWNEETIELPVKEKGVYLVVGRAGAANEAVIDASSVVIVSDIELSVQEAGGRLRIYTTNRKTGAPVGEVYVKVGNGASIQAQGFTDARGVFDVPAVKGSFSVVAEKDGNVGFWRR